MTWDSQDRLVECDYRTASGKDWTTTNDYGADGLRRRELVTDVSASTTVTTDFLLDGQNVARSFSSEGASKDKAWFTGPRGPECEVTGYAQTSGGVTTPATAQWYVYDGLGSVVGTVKPDGTVTSLRSYDPYGAATDLLTDSSGSQHKYVGGLGHPTEDQSGLIYMRARFMDPAIGRFISEDPAMDGYNWFVYAHNNPVNLVDRNGQTASPFTPENFVKGVIALIAGWYGAQLAKILGGGSAILLGRALQGIGMSMMVAGGSEATAGAVTMERSLIYTVYSYVGQAVGGAAAAFGVQQVIAGAALCQVGAAVEALGIDALKLFL